MKTTRLNSEIPSQSNHLKFYQKPVIATFGSVSKLTQGVGGSHADNGQNNTTKLGKG